MNPVYELWFWLLLVGLILFLIVVYYYSSYTKKDVPLWIYLWLTVSIFIFFIGAVLMIYSIYYPKNIVLAPEVEQIIFSPEITEITLSKQPRELECTIDSHPFKLSQTPALPIVEPEAMTGELPKPATGLSPRIPTVIPPVNPEALGEIPKPPESTLQPSILRRAPRLENITGRPPSPKLKKPVIRSRAPLLEPKVELSPSFSELSDVQISSISKLAEETPYQSLPSISRLESLNPSDLTELRFGSPLESLSPSVESY